MQPFRRIMTASTVGIVLALVFQIVGIAQDGEKNPNRAGGVIKSISGNVITTSRKNGSTMTIVVTENTTFSKNGAAATLADFQTGDVVRADGSADANGQFVATTISAGEKGSKRERRVAGETGVKSDHKGGGDKANRSGGQITAVDVTAGTVSVTRKNGAADTIRIGANASLARNGQTATLADFKAGDFVKARGSRDANGELIADTIIGGDKRPQGRKAKKP
jgi:hypothetical protein